MPCSATSLELYTDIELYLTVERLQMLIDVTFINETPTIEYDYFIKHPNQTQAVSFITSTIVHVGIASGRHTVYSIL